jgi:hypothetical protein
VSLPYSEFITLFCCDLLFHKFHNESINVFIFVVSFRRDYRQANDPLTVSYYIQRVHNLPSFGCILPVVVWSHSAKHFDSECLGRWVCCTMLKARTYRSEIELNTTDRTCVHFLEETDPKVQNRLRYVVFLKSSYVRCVLCLLFCFIQQ